MNDLLPAHVATVALEQQQEAEAGGRALLMPAEKQGMTFSAHAPCTHG